jgi:GNAT superfamily N-acetyltransferase
MLFNHWLSSTTIKPLLCSVPIFLNFTLYKRGIMKIYEVTCITERVETAFKKLIPQLGPEVRVPDKDWLQEIIASGNTRIFIAEDGDISGTLTLVFQKTPAGEKAWIEDVVVDATARGKGIGEKLVRFAVSYAEEKGITKIDLTSGPARIDANRLYQKLEFEQRETNVYRLKKNK